MDKIEEIKISQYAKEKNQSYKQIWASIKNGTFPEKTIEKDGHITILRESKASQKVEFALPVFADIELKESKASSTRRNRAATSIRTDEYFWIENGVTPFNSGRNTSSGNETVTPNEAIRLTQLAYYNFSELSSVINIMTEFSTNSIYFRGGNAKSRKFFEALFNKINIQGLQEKFFLEYYRSGNVFPYRLEAVIKDDDINNINKVYGAKAAKNVKLPVKYIIINPCSVTVAGAISFSAPQFYQTLNSYEIQRLKKPITEEDKNFYNSLPPETKKEISKNSTSSQILLPLDPQYVYTIFWKKMDYEQLSIPMAWGVLRDLNWKMEMKNIDMSVARTTQRAVLLITMGYEDKQGNYMFDTKAAEAMRNLFTSESVGRTLVGDFTTKGMWLIPDVEKVLGKAKYEQVNEDIKNNLNNVISGGANEKFANQSIKVKLFIERLKQSRETFLNEFLKLEIKRISKDLGFRSYPEPFFADIDWKDEDLFSRILAQLAGIGYLTPSEVFAGMESGRLPTSDESIESQTEFKKLKDEGLYMPAQLNPNPQLTVLDKQGKQQEKMQSQQMEHDDKIKTKELKHQKDNPVAPAPSIHINAPTKMMKPVGKPAGSRNPGGLKKKTAKPISASLIRENLILATQANTELEKQILNKFKVKKLNDIQIQLKDTLLDNLLGSENPSDWPNKEIIASYVSNPDKINNEKFEEVRKLGEFHAVNDYLASIIINSQGPETEIEDTTEE
ncbi:MAG: hypothetical protein Q7R95_02310 [bacterium]|nr:hypothetical protein [bacterium]